MSKKQGDILMKIRDVRVGNNDLWMALVAIALRAAPEETKECLARIRSNDVEVSRLMGELADED